MVYFVCKRCEKRRSVALVRANRKYCIGCAKEVGRERALLDFKYRPKYYAEKQRIWRLNNLDKARAVGRAWSKKYYAIPENALKRKERKELYMFKKELERRVVEAREDLNAHLLKEVDGKVQLDSCNICVIRQGKYDCALKLYEANLVERDVLHGDEAVSPACAIELVREVKPIVPDEWKRARWAVKE